MYAVSDLKFDLPKLNCRWITLREEPELELESAFIAIAKLQLTLLFLCSLFIDNEDTFFKVAFIKKLQLTSLPI